MLIKENIRKNRNCAKVLLCFVVLVLILFVIHPNSYSYISNDDIENELVPSPKTMVGPSSCPLLPHFEFEPLVAPKYVEHYNRTDYALRLNIKKGGHWSPDNCDARHSVAVIIPYRNREAQLDTFLHYMHPFLQKQLLNYRIVIVEQTGHKEFNRGKLMNIGYTEVVKLPVHYSCFIFHDIDLIPQQHKNIYACTKNPRHMCSSLNRWRYQLLYNGAFGGVVAILQSQFQHVNGFSNLYFGWGGEDDDLLQRIHSKNMEICRFSPEISRYYMLRHKEEKKNPARFEILKDASDRFDSDGLNSLQYKILQYENKPLYTHIIVDI